MTEFTLSIILPAFNESGTIDDVIRGIHARFPDAEIVVVDDGSADETAAVAEAAGATVYRHSYNVGNGAAIKTGIRVANGDILVFMDADGQHDPEDVARILEYFPEYDMVVGARTKNGQATVGRALGNRIYNWLASYVTKFPVKDLTSGFRAVKAEVARSFVFLLPNTYSYPTTLTLGVLRTGRTMKYVPIRVRKRSAGRSKIKFFRDGVRFFMILIRIATLYSPMRIFLPVSFVMFLLGILRYAYTYWTEGRFTNMSAMLFISAVLVFMMSLISEQICQLRFERRAVPRIEKFDRQTNTAAKN